MDIKIPSVVSLPVEEIEKLLYCGTFTTYFLVDDFYTKYQFTFEDGWFVMRVRGICGVEARKITARDFIQLLINVCLGEASYEHDPGKALLYRTMVEDREAVTESLPAVEGERGR